MEMDFNIMQYLPFIIPLILISLGLMIFSLIDISRKKRTRNMSVLIWVLIILLVNSMGVGSLLYLVFGRAENTYED